MKIGKLKFVHIVYFLYFWFLLPDFLRSQFRIIRILSMCFRLSGFIMASYFIVVYRKHSRSLKVLTVFIAYMLFTTLLNGFEISNCVRWVAIYVDIFGVAVLTEFLIKNNASCYLSIMNALCIVGIIINALSVFLLKDGLVRVPNEAGVLFPYFFYDYDNSFIIRYIYSFAIIFFYDRSHKKNNLRWIVVVAIATLLYRRSIGSVLALSMFLVCYCFRNIIRSRIINIETVWIGYGLLTLFILFVGSSNILTGFLVYYNKTASLDKRIYMWNRAIRIILHNFMLGTGVLNTSDMRTAFRYAQLHNSLMNTCLWGGFIGISLYGLFISAINKDCKKLSNKNGRKVMIFLFIAIMMASLVDGMELASGVYLFYFVVCNSKYFMNSLEQRASS